MFGAHNSVRIVAQRGTFMVWGNQVASLEQMANEINAPLWRIEVQGDRHRLASDLALLGFSETMVFPELPSLGSELSHSEGWKQ